MSRRLYWLSALVAALLLMPGNAMAGCYVGAGVGKSISAVDISDGIDGKTSVALDGAIADAHAGCDVAIPNTPFVLGAMVGYTFSDVVGSYLDGKLSTDDYWSLVGRLGYKINDNAMAYGLLGGAATKLAFDTADTAFVYGAGLELDMAGLGMGPLTAYVEWRHLDWDASAAGGTKVDPSTDTIMVGARIKLDILSGK